MNCTNCGHELPEGSVFCGNCGASLNPVSPAAEWPETPPAAKKKKPSFIPLIAALSVLALGLAVAIIVAISSRGVGGKSDSAGERKTDAGSSQTASDPVSDDPAGDPWEDAQTTFQQFADGLKQEADRNDKFALASHFVDPDKYGEKVDELFEYLTKINTDYNTDYPYLAARVIQVSDQYGVGFIYRSACLGAYPNDTQVYSTLYFPVSLQGDAWKIDYTDDCCAAVNEYKLPFPEGALAAEHTGKRFTRFMQADLSWVFNDIVTPDSFPVTLHAMWENEDGSIDCLLCAKNGTQQTRTIISTKLRVYQKATGTQLFNTEDTQSYYVAPGTSITYVVHVPASEVNSSIDWNTKLCSDTSCSSK